MKVRYTTSAKYWNRLEESFEKLLEDAPEIAEKENYNHKRIGSNLLEMEKQAFRDWAAKKIEPKHIFKFDEVTADIKSKYFCLYGDSEKKENTYVVAEDIDTSYENLLAYFNDRNQRHKMNNEEKDRLQEETLRKTGHIPTKEDDKNQLPKKNESYLTTTDPNRIDLIYCGLDKNEIVGYFMQLAGKKILTTYDVMYLVQSNFDGCGTSPVHKKRFAVKGKIEQSHLRHFVYKFFTHKAKQKPIAKRYAEFLIDNFDTEEGNSNERESKIEEIKKTWQKPPAKYKIN